MRRDILNKALQLNIEHRRRRWWHQAVRMMATVVVFTTTYALILPAITMEHETICGFTEHAHSEACSYTPVHTFGWDFQCVVEPHVHEAACYDQEGTLICGDANYLVHKHDTLCFDGTGNLICALQELEEHTHTENCYEYTTVYHCGMEAGEGSHTHTDSCYAPRECICTIEQTQGHSHGAQCYTQPVLLCQIQETPGHSHAADCYGPQELLCQDKTHAHVDECYADPELICQTEQMEGHSHGDTCYAEPELICEETEIPAHTHDDGCFTKKEKTCLLQEQVGHIHTEKCTPENISKLICEKKEVKLHQHTDTCYEVHMENNQEIRILICERLQVREHQHDEGCFAQHVHTEKCYDMQQEQPVLICTYHVHTDACYGEDQQPVCTNPVLICDMPEHSHTESCYPEVPDGMADITFEIPEEYAAYVQSGHQFPLTITLEENTVLDAAKLPALKVENPDDEAPVYLAEYHWITVEGYPFDETAPVAGDAVLTLQLYPADQPEKACLVTATFIDGEEILLSRTVHFGTVVSEVLTPEILQTLDEGKDGNLRFEGWQYSNATGETVSLKPGITTIEADTVYNTVFREYVTVTLHDLDSEGKEYPGSPQQVSLPAGDNLSAREISLGDGTQISDCLWYTHSGEPFTLDTTIQESLHLYTYSYTLLLDLQSQDEMEREDPEPFTEATEETSAVSPSFPILMRAAFAAESDVIPPEQADVDNDQTPENVSIVKRRGVELTESDFLVDGVNYTDYLWQDEDGNNVDADELVGTSLTSNYALVRAAGQDYTINYNMNISQTVFGTRPSLGGQSTLTEVYNSGEGTYTPKVPNPTQYMVVSGNKKTLYTFTGWRSSQGNTITPGGTVDASWISNNTVSRYGSSSNRYRMNLTAQWTAVPVTETVHFFVNLNCQVEDTSGNTGIPNSGNYTHSVYSTTMTVTGSNMKNNWLGPKNTGSSTQYILLRADNASQTAQIDAEIRKLITGYDTTNVRYNGTSVWRNSYTGTKIFQLYDFPSDEQVLSVVRDMVEDGTEISMNGVKLEAEDLTSSNFTVRWNVCKYDTGDGWHIDGVLVGKQAQLVVKKTFQGDDATIEEVKNNGYYLRLDNTTSTSAPGMILTLRRADLESDANTYGFSQYDADTDTYTWNLPLQQDHTYKISEWNYESREPEVQESVVYTVSNSPDAFTGWRAYPKGGITGVKAYSYANDISSTSYQVVTIRNTYVKADTLTINKIDMATGNGLGGISYELLTPSGDPVSLYQKPGTSYYSMKSEDADVEFTYPVPQGIITTDKNGTIFLKLNNGTFTLKEAFPTGYGGASKITVTVGVDDAGNVVFDQVTSSDSTIQVNGTLVDKNTATLTIRNVSFPTSVTAQKVWNNSKDAQEVTVALYRNGVDMGTTYRAKLNAGNNWQYTWNDLPLYVDGGVAKYSLREIQIGSTNYDPSADTDGYAGYIVAYDEMIYRKNGAQVSGPVWVDDKGVTQYADNAHLVVRNEVYRGQMIFLKVDGEGKPLPGAEFKLYSDAAQTTLVAEATSDEHGRVVFENLMPDTYYVVKETNSPDGYVGGDSLYKIRLTPQGGTTLEDSASGEVLTAIVNYLDTASVEIEKKSAFGTYLSDAQFQLEKWEGEAWVSQSAGKTDESGTLVLGELHSGVYRLIEVRPPDGFMPIPGAISFTMEQGELIISNPHELWSVRTDEESGSIIITVINESGYVLPKTGGITMEACYAAGITLLLAALAMLLVKRRKGAAPY